MSHRVVSCLVLMLVASALGQPAESIAAEQPNVFDLPRIQGQHQLLQARLIVLFQRGEFAEAQKVCEASIKLVPHDPGAHYNLACALVRQGKIDEGLKALERAVELGFTNVQHIATDKDLEPLKGHAELIRIVEKARTIKPDLEAGWKQTATAAAIEKGEGIVSEANTVWDSRNGVFRVFFKMDPAERATEPVAKGYGEAGDLLRQWFAQGTAAGNRGDLYDNHDGDHSNMDYGSFPQITRIEFSDAAKKRNLHHGLQTSMFFNAVTIGNSSTAMVAGPYWRSQGRLALTNPRSAMLLYLQYTSNHLYFYPEHRDHDPGINGRSGGGHGDVFPANTPYMVISQGSSGSDRVFMNAFAATLAAFHPEVKATLTKSGLLMPTLQMIFRMSNKTVTRPEDYLTGAAHPTVFDGKHLDEVKMVRMAHSLTKETLPPIAGLKVMEESKGVPGVDYFDVAEREVLFDTPCAIARVVRSTRYIRRMVITAQGSKDLNDKPLTYHWSVLRGKKDEIKINKLNDEGSIVEILVPYHERMPIEPGSDMESTRVDIGAFVHNGTHYSPPALVSLFYLDNEKRVYGDEQRIKMVDYADAQASLNYVDPMIDMPKDWRDEYVYDEEGRSMGWFRIRGNEKQRFTADGYLITKTNEQGAVLETKKVQYVPRQRPNLGPALEQKLLE